MHLSFLAYARVQYRIYSQEACDLCYGPRLLCLMAVRHEQHALVVGSLTKQGFAPLPSSPFYFPERQLKANLSWRIENHVAAALRAEPWEVSGCASEKKFDNLCKSYYPHYVLGSDRNGRPVLVQKVGSCGVVVSSHRGEWGT